MSELLVRAALPNLDEAERFQYRDDLARLQNWNVRQVSRYSHGLRPDKLSVEPRWAVFQQHRDDLAEILLELVQRRPLRVGTWPAGDVPDE